MKNPINTKRCFLFVVSFLLAFILNFSIALASPDVADPLPKSGLPELPDYKAEYSTYNRAKAMLPTAYDSRNLGYITPVRNQDPFGTCWVFGALASGEAGMIKNGIANSNIDLSELHLAYFFYHPKADPLGNTKGDTLHSYTYQNYMDSGGNNLFTMFALTKWAGAAAEKIAPYRTTLVSSLSASLAYTDVAHLQNARFVNTKDLASVKNLIMQYGAVSTDIYYNHSFLNEATNAYLSPIYGEGSNHIVTLVGWDDNYPKENFNFINQPNKNGAWIAKNSYGTDYGDQGYVYVSYEDTSLVNASLSYAFDMESASNYDYNYQYDGSYGSGILELNSGGSISNIYTVKGNSKGNEKLEAVSFSLFSQNVDYSIQVYKNPKKGAPASGIPMFTTPPKGKTTYSGYYTIPLTTQPVFTKGDTFSVVITLSANTSAIQVFADSTVTVADLIFYSETSANQSFFKKKSSGSWIDLSEDIASPVARIKAFTSKTSTQVTPTENITSTLKQPKISSLSSISSTKNKLKWKKINKAKGYQIFRSTSRNGTYKRIKTTSALSCTDPKRSIGVTYFYKIRAYRVLNGKNAYSKYSSVKSITIKPAKVSLTSVKSAGSNKWKLTWKKVSGASGYEIYRSTAKKKNYKLAANIAKGSAKAYTDQVPKKNTYYYKMRVYRMVKGKKVYGAFSSIIKN